MDRFEIENRVVLKGILSDIRNTCDFYFKKSVSKSAKPNRLLFADRERIFELNYETE